MPPSAPRVPADVAAQDAHAVAELPRDSRPSLSSLETCRGRCPRQAPMGPNGTVTTVETSGAPSRRSQRPDCCGRRTRSLPRRVVTPASCPAAFCSGSHGQRKPRTFGPCRLPPRGRRQVMTRPDPVNCPRRPLPFARVVGRTRRFAEAPPAADRPAGWTRPRVVGVVARTPRASLAGGEIPHGVVGAGVVPVSANRA